MEYAKKTPLGYKTATYYDCSHVILTREEYSRMAAERDMAVRERDEAEDRELQNREKVKKEAQKKIEEHEKRCQEIVRKNNEQNTETIRKLRKQVEHEKKLNTNLLRVATERANKARERDKHERGYLLLNWQPWRYRRIIKYPNGKTEEKYYNFYKVTIQTPWDCSLPEEQIENLVVEAIKENELEISDKSIGYFTENHNMDEIMDKIEGGEHMVLHRQYRSNVKDGLWEVTLTTTFEPIVLEKHRVKYV